MTDILCAKLDGVLGATFDTPSVVIALRLTDVGPCSHAAHATFCIYDLRSSHPHHSSASTENSGKLVATVSSPGTFERTEFGHPPLVGPQVGMPVARGGLVDEQGAFHFGNSAVFRIMFEDDRSLSGTAEPVVLGLIADFKVFRDILAARSPMDPPTVISGPVAGIRVCDLTEVSRRLITRKLGQVHGTFMEDLDVDPCRVWQAAHVSETQTDGEHPFAPL